MDAQSRSVIGPQRLLTYDFSAFAEIDDDFSSDLSSVPEARLLQWCDALFLELDSVMPDLRAKERYQAACDEIAFRRISAGVA